MTVAPLIRKSVAILLVQLALGGPAVAQSHSASVDSPIPWAERPEDVGLSSERLARLTQVTRGHVESGMLPGAVLLIARRDQIAYWEAFGYLDRQTQAPMTRDAIFRIYSMTKPIVSVAAMMLQEEGLLQLGDPVSRYLPELANLQVQTAEVNPGTQGATYRNVPMERPIIIQDLHRHTSGFTSAGNGSTPVHRMYSDARLISPARNVTNAELVTALSRMPLLFQPGTRWEYSVSTDVLGRVVEVVSERSLADFLEERIFRPLGMHDTAFWLEGSQISRAAQPSQPISGVPMTERFDVAARPRQYGGGGGLLSTASDYLRFAQMLLNGGELDGVRILGSKTVEFMTSDHLGTIPRNTPGLGWGLGVEVRTDSGIARLPGSVGEYGWAGNSGTIFWVDPAEELIAIYMIQVSEGDRVFLRNQFKTLVSQAIVD